MSSSGRVERLRALLAERIFVLDGAMGTAIQSRDLERRRLRRPGARRVQRAPRPHPARRHPAHPPGLHRRRRRPDRDRQFRRHAHRPRRVRAAGQGLRDQPRRARAWRARSPTPRRRPTGRASSPARWGRARRRSRSPENVTFDAGARRLRRADGRAWSRAAPTCSSSRRSRTRSTSRRRCSASTTPSRSSAARSRSSSRCRSRPGARCSPGSRSSRCTSRSPTATCFAIGLNCATGPDFMTDHLRTLAEISRFPDLVLPQRRPARRGGALQRAAADAGEEDRALLRRGLDQHHRRLLRHHRRAHPHDRRDRRALPARASRSTVRRSVVSGLETLVDRRGHAPGRSSASAPTCSAAASSSS